MRERSFFMFGNCLKIRRQAARIRGQFSKQGSSATFPFSLVFLNGELNNFGPQKQHETMKFSKIWGSSNCKKGIRSANTIPLEEMDNDGYFPESFILYYMFHR